MYVLLRGQVTVYHDDGAQGDSTTEDHGAAAGRGRATKTAEDQLRRQLGAFVVSLNGQCVAIHTARPSSSVACRAVRTESATVCESRNSFRVIILFKLALHDADTDTDTDSPNTATILRPIHAIFLAGILARMSVSVSVSASWNSRFTPLEADATQLDRRVASSCGRCELAISGPGRAIRQVCRLSVCLCVRTSENDFRFDVYLIRRTWPTKLVRV